MSPTSPQTEEFTASSRILDDRWTCRQFKPDQIPRDTIEALLRLAQRTPSWCNTQPWQVVLTEGAGTDRFRNEPLEHVATATPEPDFAPPVKTSTRSPPGTAPDTSTAPEAHNSPSVRRRDRHETA